MKAKLGPAELIITKEDYDALQKLSNIGLFQLISEEIGYLRQCNLLRICKKYEKKCKKYNKDPKQITPKFLMKFIEAASYEDDESIQEIWADLLLKEATSPNSNSLRTIDVLQNLSKEEAIMFANTCKDAFFINNDPTIYNNEGHNRSLNDILRLVDSGLLISINTMVESTTKVQKNSEVLPYISPRKNLAIKIINKTDNELSCKISIFSLTEAGKDIFEASIAKDIADACFIKNAKKIKENNKNLIISLHKIVSIKGTNITYSNQDLLSKNEVNENE